MSTARSNTSAYRFIARGHSKLAPASSRVGVFCARGYESTLGLLHDVLPPKLAEFLSPIGTDWDAPVEGEIFATPPVPLVPGPAVVHVPPVSLSDARVETLSIGSIASLGSNNWAVAGTRTMHGGALLASDMHLGHAVPNIWYRAVLRTGANTAVGVTLPGTPFLVAGSNTHVAWGFTNTNGDWIDLVEIEMHPERVGTYRTAEGWTALDVHEETIHVADGAPEVFTVRETIWGPIVPTKITKARRARCAGSRTTSAASA